MVPGLLLVGLLLMLLLWLDRRSELLPQETAAVTQELVWQQAPPPATTAPQPTIPALPLDPVPAGFSQQPVISSPQPLQPQPSPLPAEHLPLRRAEPQIPGTAVGQPLGDTVGPNGDSAQARLLQRVAAAIGQQRFVSIRSSGQAADVDLPVERPTSPRYLVGLRLTMARFGVNYRFTAISSLQPIWETANGRVPGKTVGVPKRQGDNPRRRQGMRCRPH